MFQLYNIIVRNAQIGRDLLKNGNLKHRVTILPLDKIEGRVLDSRKLQRAQNLVSVTDFEKKIFWNSKILNFSVKIINSNDSENFQQI